MSVLVDRVSNCLAIVQVLVRRSLVLLETAGTELEVQVLPHRTGENLDDGAVRLESLQSLDRLGCRRRLDDVDLTALEGIDDRLSLRDEPEDDAVEVRQLLTGLGVGLPVVVVADNRMNSPFCHLSNTNGPADGHMVSFQSATKSVPSTACFGMMVPKMSSYRAVGAASVYVNVLAPTSVADDVLVRRLVDRQIRIHDGVQRELEVVTGRSGFRLTTRPRHGSCS